TLVGTSPLRKRVAASSDLEQVHSLRIPSQNRGSQGAMFRFAQLRISPDHFLGRLSRAEQQLGIADQIGHSESRKAVLRGPEQISRAPQAQVFFGDAESVRLRLEHPEPLSRF